MLKKVVNWWVKSSLILKIFGGLVIGAILGIAVPQATGISILGTVFVGALKGIAPILVFVLVASALSKAHAGVGNRFKSVIILYMCSTLCSAAVAVFGSFLFPVSMKLVDYTGDVSAAPSSIFEVLKNLLTNIFTNPVSSMANANYLGILFWAILMGVCLKKVGHEGSIQFMEDLANVVSMTVRGIIQFAPFGILGLVFESVSVNGLSIFVDYGKILALLVGSMLFVALVSDPIIAAIKMKRNPYPLVFRCLKESGITAFFTRSSAANIPINMNLCKRLGLDEDFYSVSIPLGSTINMDGAAVTITVMTLATCHTMGVAVDIPTALLLSVLATLGACGASGVAGGSLLLIPMACSLFGISNDIAMQVVGVGFIIGVIQDSVETAINSSGDAMYTAAAEYAARAKNGEEVNFLGEFAKK